MINLKLFFGKDENFKKGCIHYKIMPEYIITPFNEIKLVGNWREAGMREHMTWYEAEGEDCKIKLVRDKEEDVYEIGKGKMIKVDYQYVHIPFR